MQSSRTRMILTRRESWHAAIDSATEGTPSLNFGQVRACLESASQRRRILWNGMSSGREEECKFKIKMQHRQRLHSPLESMPMRLTGGRPKTALSHISQKAHKAQETEASGCERRAELPKMFPCVHTTAMQDVFPRPFTSCPCLLRASPPPRSLRSHSEHHRFLHENNFAIFRRECCRIPHAVLPSRQKLDAASHAIIVTTHPQIVPRPDHGKQAGDVGRVSLQNKVGGASRLLPRLPYSEWPTTLPLEVERRVAVLLDPGWTTTSDVLPLFCDAGRRLCDEG